MPHGLPIKGRWKFVRPDKVLVAPTDAEVKLSFLETRRRGADYHGSVDIQAPTGEKVYAVHAGGVAFFDDREPWRSGWGRHLGMTGTDGHGWVYAHLSDIDDRDAKVGAEIRLGEFLGRVGATGPGVSGPHLHPEWMWTPLDRASRVDPYWLFAWLAERQAGITRHLNVYPFPSKGDLPLERGDRSYGVGWAQWALGKHAIHHEFNGATEKLVRRFQKARGLRVNGTIDRATRDALRGRPRTRAFA